MTTVHTTARGTEPYDKVYCLGYQVHHEDWSPYPRINKLRQTFLDRGYDVDVERLRLVTESYQQHEHLPEKLKVAYAFENVLLHCGIEIYDDDLIVGEIASPVKSAPIYPEFSVNWILDEVQNHPFEQREHDQFTIRSEEEKQELMKSLEQLVGTLMNNGKSSDTGEKEKDGDRLQQSVNTYEQISGQLNDFYETPKETANSDLERKVDELNKKLEEAEKEKNKAATREELMERSYKMAAKYLNPDKDTVQEKAVGKEPTETVPVQRAEYQTTSGLSQPVTDSAYIASLTVERNYGFNTAVGNSYQMGTNTIAACISENQIIEQGGRVKLRLLQPLQAGNITVPENSLVTGAAVIQGERLDILISSIEYAGNIIPVQLATYDIDGQKGIFVPGSETRNAAKDAAGTVSESMGNSVSFARSAGQQVVMDLTRGVMQGGTRLIAGRVRAVKVTLKAGYKVLLVTKRQ